MSSAMVLRLNYVYLMRFPALNQGLSFVFHNDVYKWPKHVIVRVQETQAS